MFQIHNSQYTVKCNIMAKLVRAQLIANTSRPRQAQGKKKGKDEREGNCIQDEADH